VRDLRDLGNGGESAGNSSERKEGRKARASETGPRPTNSDERDDCHFFYTTLFLSLLLSFEGPKEFKSKRSHTSCLFIC
jgi:hypothetical protein